MRKTAKSVSLRARERCKRANKRDNNEAQR